MKVYIENIRDEIFAQYEKCFYGREQMESFLPLYSSKIAFRSNSSKNNDQWFSFSFLKNL